MPSYVAWLRGINVGSANKGRRTVPMSELRIVADAIGLTRIQTYIQSGNLLFDSDLPPAALEDRIEVALADYFEADIPVVVTPAGAVRALETECPFPEAAEARPKFVQVGFAKKRPFTDAADGLARYCTAGERIAAIGTRIWIDFPSGIGRSKVTSAVLERCAGTPVTMRNLVTIRAVAARLDPA